MDVMNVVLDIKFAQDSHCRRVLLSTAGSMLVEHSKTDSFWGDGGDASGANNLGHCLIRLREELLLVALVEWDKQKPIHHPIFQKEPPPKRQVFERNDE